MDESTSKDHITPETSAPHDLSNELLTSQCHDRSVIHGLSVGGQEPPGLPPVDARPEWGGRRVLESLVVFALGVGIMCAIYGNSAGVPGHDSYYHIKMAAILPETGLLHEFPWLRFTYFTDEGHEFVSHHYGFHVLLIPLVHLSHWLTGDYVPGARWAMATFFGLSLMLFNLILATSGVRWRWLWLVLFMLMPYQFFTRHAYVRAISPSLVFMLLIILLMCRRRHVLTGLAVAGYVHLYLGGVIYAPLLVGLYVLSSMIGPRGARGVPWALIVWATAGWVVGIAVHPYSSGMWEFLRLQVFGSGLAPDISVGREWKPYENLWWFAQMSGAVLIVWAAAVSLRLRMGGSLSAHEMMLLLAHFVFFGLMLKARRFVEYWPVLCLLSSACLTGPIVERWAVWWNDKLASKGIRAAIWIRRVVVGALVASMFVIVYTTPVWRMIRRSAECKYDLPAIREAMSFLQEHSEPGDVVFTDDWDIFPVYFYYNSSNHYIVGMDPKFTHARDPVLWERYVKVSRGQVPADISVKVQDKSGLEKTETIHVAFEDIRDHFGAKYVVTDRDHRLLSAKLSTRSDFAELIYPSDTFHESRDEPYLIFGIRNGE